MKEDNFLIFEDDSIMNDININEINDRLSLIPNDWDIYLLSDINLCYSKNKLYKNLFKINRFFLLNAYIINKNAINKIFNSNTLFPINQQLDSYLTKYIPEFPKQVQLKLPQLKKIELPKLKKVENVEG
jgi:hypothetical protein